MDSTTCLFMAFMKIFFHFCILDYPQVFAKLIARAAKDVDLLIDSLPSEDSSLELQVRCIKKKN